MSLASMIAKQVVKATGDMFNDTDVQKAISAQVDDVLTSEALQGKDGQDYLVKMTKAMLNDDPNFKPDVDRDPNLGLYLEVEHKLFSGNPGMRDAYHAAKINNAGIRGETRDFSDATLRPYNAVPAPATYDEMFDALHSGKKEKINEPIADGSEVAIRLDIPAYLEKNTWVPTIHFGNKTSHRATVALKNANFAPSKGNEEQAFRIKIGSEVKKEIDKLAKEGRLRTGFRSGDLEKGDLIDASTKEGKKQIDKLKAAYNKTNYSRIKGSLINRTDEENYRLAQEALNDPEWTQIGYNPDRHTYYFDRATGDPIIGGDEVIQVGHLVLVKNAVRSDRRNFKYAEGGAVTRKIKSGDTLSKISKETGVSVSDLVKLNNIENPDFIRAGDTLILKEETKRQPNRREIKDAMQRGKPDRSIKAFEDNVLREEPKPSNFRQLSGIRGAAIRRTKAAPTESRSLTTRSRQRPTRDRTEPPASLLTSTPLKTFITGLFSSPILKEDFLRVDEYKALQDLARGAINRGRSGLSYRDYNKEAGSRIGYKMETPTEIATDPFQALKFTLGKAEIVRDGDKIIVADEFDFSGDDNIAEQSLVDKIKFLADRTGQYFSDDISAYGLAHSVGEVLNPEGSGPSFRIGLGNANDLGISDEQFADLPTLEDYNSRYAGRIKQRMAEGGTIPKDMYRKDGSKKSARGFLGPVKNLETGKTMTELSIDIPIDGKEVQIPTMVPTLTAEEIKTLQSQDWEGKAKDLPRSIVRKAGEHARKRMDAGLNPFYQDGEERQAKAKGGKIDKKKMKCNKPKRTPSHPKKSHVVKACKDGKEKIIRFGEQGAKTAGKPKAGESKRMKAKRKSFKARHRKNIKRGNMSAAYWADKVKW